MKSKKAVAPSPAPGREGVPARILLVDDHGPTREEMVALLSRERDLQVIAQSDSGEDAIQKARLLRPDVVVMDIFLPGISGVEATASIIRDEPATRVVALSNHCGRSVVNAFIKAGGIGYVRKSAAFEELVPALRAALNGQSYMGHEIH
jgi:two-component system invasion response regulator UvrY